MSATLDDKSANRSVAQLRRTNPVSAFFARPVVRRLIGCLSLGFMLALMVGSQQGSRNDYTVSFRQAVFDPRIFVFLGIGVALFVVITLWPRIKGYLVLRGIRPLAASTATIVASLVLLKWSDNGAIVDGKFGTLAPLAAQTGTLAPMARAFFTPGLAIGLIVVAFLLVGAAIVTGRALIAWIGGALALVGGLWGYLAAKLVDDLLVTPNHSTGSAVFLLGMLALAATSAAVGLSRSTMPDTTVISRALGWRPGLPLAVLGMVVGLEAYGQATWFAPLSRNWTFTQSASGFSGAGLAPIAMSYLQFLGWVLLAATLVMTGLATFRRNALLGWLGVAVSLAGAILTLLTMYLMSGLAADLGIDNATGHWRNLGAGPWMAALAYTLFAGAGLIAALGATGGLTIKGAVPGVVLRDSGGSGMVNNRSRQLTVAVAVIAVALFLPPMMTDFWQKVLVTEIGVYVLLAIGLNVVVGWAGLLDLGFIAFYAIGSYTTAFLVGSLPVKPPWGPINPLLAIPFAIIICLLAGVALGSPTLRLRGDYLAIVTLGFGEIIRIAAINLGNVTNSTRGPSPAVPHPSIHLGPINVDFGLDNVQYWYLLLVIIGLIVLLFNRLEHSRLGRAWAAVREDEVAAQATGVNTVRVKLLAFAIGASTSGIAGVFFASQVGYFNPDNFVLNNSILVVAYVVFGGMGSLPGAMAGAAMLTWLPWFLKDQVPAEDRQMWIGVVVLLMMIFRPAGLIPAKRRRAELSGFDDAAPDTRAVPASEGM